MKSFVREITDFIFADDFYKTGNADSMATMLKQDTCKSDTCKSDTYFADAIFVPGSAFGELAVTAAGLYKKGLAPLVIPSGRFALPVGHCTVPGYETEGAYFRDILLREGVPAEAILTDELATYTYENAIYTRRMTDEKGLQIKKAILCPQAYHARRCLQYYQICFPETEILVCPTVTREISRDNWFLSEEKIDVVLGEVEKCGSQFHEIFKNELHGISPDIPVCPL